MFFKVPPEVRRGPEWETAWSKLRARTSLVEKKHGEVIYEEGEAYDGTLYVVSLGQVKVTKRGAGGDRILGYMRRGDIIGEIGYLASLEAPEETKSSDDDSESSQAQANVRTATCTAFFHPTRGQNRKGDEPRRVELVRIEADAFSEFLQAVPQVREVLDALREERTRRDTSKPEEMASVLAGRFAELGLIQGEKLMLIDLVRCTRCDECVRACVKTHHDGRTRLLREGPRFGDYLVPASCRQCNDPVCLSGCPVASIHKGNGGQIVIEDWCIGCTKCAEQCPYDAINMYDLPAQGEESKSPGRLAAVCDQCQSLSDGVPSCVYACPHDAALRVDAMSFFTDASAAASSARQAG